MHAVANHFFRLHGGQICLDIQFDIIPACVTFNLLHNYFSDQMRKICTRKIPVQQEERNTWKICINSIPFRRNSLPRGTNSTGITHKLRKGVQNVNICRQVRHKLKQSIMNKNLYKEGKLR